MTSPIVPPSTARGFRADIQALRAVAVLLVVGYHLHPGIISGGYVGVDVFFVISGFLITAHLIREHESTGRIALARFYARRIRRLLPAALLVLLVAALLYATVMPASMREQGFRELAASALYVENWILAFSSVDYLGAAAAPSLVQHYWSLSVEEQFYIVWPVLLLVAGFAARKTRALRSRRAWLVALLAVFASSLVSSLLITAAAPGWAYFVTPTRAWEFAAGGLVFLLAERVGALAPVVRTAASWVGLLAIVASAFFYSANTPFPGAAALVPVLGTAIVIAAGDPRSRWSPMRLGRAAPVQFVGGISYAVYLWHWPLIVLYPIVIGHALGLRGMLLVLTLTLLLSTASKYLVEDPFIRRGARSRRTWPTLACAATAMALIVAMSAAQITAIESAREVAALEQEQVAQGPCYGARALLNADCTGARDVPETLDTTFAATDFADTTLGDCGAGATVSTIGDAVECSFGDETSDKLVVMVGDSHAGHWLPAVQAIGEDRGWRIVTFFRSSCPFTDATPSASGVFQAACEEWRGLVEDRVAELAPSLLLVASLSPHGYEAADFQPGPIDEMEAGYVSTLERLAASSTAVIALRDTPFMGISVPDCLGTTSSGAPDCSRQRAAVLDANADPLWDAADRVPTVGRVDLTDAFCDDVTCFAVTGGVVIFRDHHHLGASYSRSLAPQLLDGIRATGVPLP